MICEQCNKTQATVHVTDVGRGESHLCEACARAAAVLRPGAVQDWCARIEVTVECARRIRDILRREKYWR